MKHLQPDMIKQAAKAKNPEELMAFAAEQGIELTEEAAATLMSQLNTAHGQLDDDELENVSGGGCYSNGQLIVTNFHSCGLWVCEDCGGTGWGWEKAHDEMNRVHRCGGRMMDPGCANCKYMKYNGLQLCTHPDNR